MKITTVLENKKLSQKFQNSWGVKSFIRLGLTATKNKLYYKNIVTFYYITKLFKLVLFSLKKIVLLTQYFHNNLIINFTQ